MRISDLAHAVDVTEGAIRQMESGQTKNASFPVGVRLARELRVSPYYLAGEKEPNGNGDSKPQASEPETESLARLAHTVWELQAAAGPILDALAEMRARLDQVESDLGTRRGRRKRGAG